MEKSKDSRILERVRTVAEDIGRCLDIDVSLKLWDGSSVPLGRNVTSDIALTIAGPGVIASILRWPTLDRLIRHYVRGDIAVEGGTLLEFGSIVSDANVRDRIRELDKWAIARQVLPLLIVPADNPGPARQFGKNTTGARRSKEDNKAYIQFHYDIGNDFYRLFLDTNLIYSCGYFKEWPNSIEQAQSDKLDIICRKLRLKPGERFLDIGCGWGALICHAAKNYGVVAHGITLSDEQVELSKERIGALDLADKVTVESADYQDLDGVYDKIASIGMYEHVGLKNIPIYMKTARRLLSDNGLFLNHAISKRAKNRRSNLMERAERRAVVKYIFPGGELVDIGHSIAAMEQEGFEVLDVESWRWHYAMTTQHWHDRLYARRSEAEALVGAPTTRIWLAYLAGCCLSFRRGGVRIYQTLASKSAMGLPPVPATRADLYH